MVRVQDDEVMVGAAKDNGVCECRAIAAVVLIDVVWALMVVEKIGIVVIVDVEHLKEGEKERVGWEGLWWGYDDSGRLGTK